MTADFPAYRGRMEYVCLDCGARYPGDSLLYTCPQCGGVFLLENLDFDQLKARSGQEWRTLFDSRAVSRTTALRGIFRYYELLAPLLEEDDIVYLGEGLTPIVEAAPALRALVGQPFAYKNDGQNPSASFKDRGMACAFSYLKWLCRRHNWDEVLTVCASTGDTSAAAALYAAYVGAPLKSVVLLPHGKVTPQQLSQPLGSGATVLELPGVFDDCMKVVELLAENYRVALLNSKNSWRILGQESYAYETAQWYGWNVADLCLFVPIGNAGNITAIMSGFLKLLDLGIITALPRVFGVQSEHADPVWRSRRLAALAARYGAAQRGPGRHDRQPRVLPPRAPSGRTFCGKRRPTRLSGGARHRAADHGRHAPGQPPRAHCLHPGRRMPGRPAQRPRAGSYERQRTRPAGRHSPRAQILRLPGHVFFRQLSPGLRRYPGQEPGQPPGAPPARSRTPGLQPRRLYPQRRCGRGPPPGPAEKGVEVFCGGRELLRTKVPLSPQLPPFPTLPLRRFPAWGIPIGPAGARKPRPACPGRG